MWLPIVVHSVPLMMPMFFTDSMVKNRSLSARSFQFLFMAGEKMKEAKTETKRSKRETSQVDSTRLISITRGGLDWSD